MLSFGFIKEGGVSLSRTDQLEEHLIAIRRHLHQYPELSNEEYETTKFIRKCLEENNISILETKLKTGVIAEIKGKKEGPIIAIRADIDALPIEEKTGLSYASKIRGKMHACGHDFHTAAAIGAAYLLKENEENLNGTIKLIFQPAEELGGGAEKVIKDGHIRNVEAIIGIHNKPDLQVGTIGLKAGALMAAVDRFQVVFRGKGSHAAMPHNGSDPITASAYLITALQTIVSRNVSPLHSAVVSVTKIIGGSTWNVIPGDVTIEGTIRTFDHHIRQEVEARFRKIIEHTASGFSQEFSIRWFPGPPPLQNNPAVTEILHQSANSQALHIIDPVPSMAGEDFSYYLQHIPGAFVFFGTNGNEDWHHPAFTIDEKSLMEAAQFLYKGALSVLNHYMDDYYKLKNKQPYSVE